MLVRDLPSLKKHSYPVLASPTSFSQHKGQSLVYEMGEEGKSLLVFIEWFWLEKTSNNESNH